MIRVLSLLAAATPPPDFDEDLVTPTWVGFAITFLVALATVFLLMDMVRRVRRTRYRGEIQERLDAERAAEDGVDDSTEGVPEPPTRAPEG